MSVLGQIEIARRPGCPTCGAVLSPPAVGEFFRCPQCLQQLRIPAGSPSPETLPCVACSGRLLAYAGADGQLVIDFCSGCEGFWFDGDELQKLVTCPQLVDSFPLPPAAENRPPCSPPPPAAVRAARPASCPRCNSPMSPWITAPAAEAAGWMRASWKDSAPNIRRPRQLPHRPRPPSLNPGCDACLAALCPFLAHEGELRHRSGSRARQPIGKHRSQAATATGRAASA